MAKAMDIFKSETVIESRYLVQVRYLSALANILYIKGDYPAARSNVEDALAIC
jgi:hypothetical protein